MKLAFADGHGSAKQLARGSFVVGASNDDDIYVEGFSGNLVLTVDNRGISLNVDELAAGLVTVNSRAIREKCFLRLGDEIRIGGKTLVLLGEDLDTSTPPPFQAISTESGLPAKNHLRAIDGPYAGQIFQMNKPLIAGPSADADLKLGDLSEDLEFGAIADRCYVKPREGAGSPFPVNGHLVTRAELKAGDQLVLGESRFLLEAPGLVPGKAYSGEDRSTERAGSTQVFSAAALDMALKDHEKKQQSDSASPAESGNSRLDNIIIAICMALSAAMLIFLFWVL